MKNTNFLITSLLILSCTCLQAQSKWFASPSTGIAVIDKKIKVGYNANITLGRYLCDFGAEGQNGRLRADICAGYYYFPGNSVYSTSALFSACGSSDKWYNSFSFGLGAQKSENHSNFDFIIPLRVNIAYRFNKNLCLGLDSNINMNLSDFWAGSPVSLGLFLGIGI